jgi:hypothetical protein
MPHRITFVVDAFKGPHEERHSHNALSAMLRALTLIDVSYLMTHPETPLLYQSGVRYEEEPPGQEDWQDIPTTLGLKVGDCEDLACWRAAELQVRFGEKAWPVFRHQKRPNGSYLYHILVRRADGRIEDPSRILGMR